MYLTKITELLKGLLMNITAILFLLGVIIINYAIYRYVGEFEGLIAIGISMMFVAWLLTYESNEGKR